MNEQDGTSSKTPKSGTADGLKSSPAGFLQVSQGAATVIAAFIGLVGVAIGHVATSWTTRYQAEVNAGTQIAQQGDRLKHEMNLQNTKQKHEIELEKQRFVQQTISAIVGKGTEEQQRQALRFYANIKIIGEPYATEILKAKPEDLPVATPTPSVAGPRNLNGFVIYVDRTRTEQRPGTFSRTVGIYRATFEGQPLDGLEGTTVERGGPGDNTVQGVLSLRRIEPGVYPLYTAAGSRYVTNGYSIPTRPDSRPLPGIGLGETGARSSILIHPGQGYLTAIGTVNLAKSIKDLSDNIEFQDSSERVIALIAAMKEKLGPKFPSTNGARIPDAWLVIAGDP